MFVFGSKSSLGIRVESHRRVQYMTNNALRDCVAACPAFGPVLRQLKAKALPDTWHDEVTFRITLALVHVT